MAETRTVFVEGLNSPFGMALDVYNQKGEDLGNIKEIRLEIDERRL